MCMRPMLIFLLQVYFLVTAYILQRVYGNDCGLGWFGLDCIYLCHCSVSVNCDGYSGECLGNEPCKVGYFGPGCQSLDLVYWDTEKSVPLFLRDSNDSTCNPDPKAVSVVLLQKNPYPFSWFRIVVNNKENLLKFTTTLDDNQPCSNERKFKVSDTVVDVTCDVTVTFQKLRIDGAIAGSICSVYINGGINKALLQFAYQISDFYDAEASRAVDGVKDSNTDNGFCSHTDEISDPQKPVPWWYVKFSWPHRVYKAVIYNRNAFQYRLRGFKLETLQQDDTVAFSYVDESKKDNNTYVINILSQTPVIAVKITQAPSFSSDERILTLCEVEIFADSACLNKAYGLYCQHPCHCNRTERCNPIKGTCAPGCPPGYYGFNCTSRCSVNCFQDISDWVTGECLQCKPGYLGNRCDKECSPGFYGHQCMLTCPDRCHSICNNTNGLCKCKTEFTGRECTECSPGFYGLECQDKCSERCQEVCDPIDGTCVCKTQFSGPNCTECSPGYYGLECNYNCSERCQDVCESITGTCNCKSEFTGPNCTECSPGYYGLECNYNCSERCQDVCESITGTCNCKSEFTGPNCTECSPGYYGLECNYNCSDRCQDVCESITGTCNCKSEFTGPNCTDCASTLYGAQCESKCSERCLQHKCDPRHGSCVSCAPGYIGDSCEKVTDARTTWLLIFAILILLLLLLIVAHRRNRTVYVVSEDDNAQ